MRASLNCSVIGGGNGGGGRFMCAGVYPGCKCGAWVGGRLSGLA